ncbi:uncharacterized protein LOC129728165 [Wyeomyia smithii]|uniref:uncharacterized protein LOC129728165 n=1 Tax=Wyeomyia smithii TaxID=174621 RepID=UPI002467AF46|nr:uncharacterized protein LOC129728165 [Wyeomyia smithii]
MSSLKPVCRICLSTDELQVSLYGQYADKHKILTKIRVCLPISIERDDSLPKTICHNCVARLDQYYDYYCNSLTSQRVLEDGKMTYRDIYKSKVMQGLTAAAERRDVLAEQERTVPALAAAIQRPCEGKLSQCSQRSRVPCSGSTYVIVPRSPGPLPSNSFLDIKHSHRKKSRSGFSKMRFRTYDERKDESPLRFD